MILLHSSRFGTGHGFGPLPVRRLLAKLALSQSVVDTLQPVASAPHLPIFQVSLYMSNRISSVPGTR